MKWKKSAGYVVILAVYLGLLALGVAKVNDIISGMLKTDMVNQLQDSAKYTAEQLGMRANNDFKELQRLAAAVGALGGPENQEAMEFILRDDWKAQGARIILSDSRGQSQSNDGLTGDVADEDIFKQAMQGTSSISELRPPLVNKEEEARIVMMVPVETANKVVGTLAISHEAAYYQEMLEFTLYDSPGSSAIVRADGGEVVSHVIAGQELNLKGEPAEQLAAGKSGSIEMKDEEGKVYCLAYAPIDINDWHLVSRMDFSATQWQREILLRVSGTVAILAVVLFVVLLAVLYILDRRKTRAMEKMALYDNLTGLYNWQYMQNRFEPMTARGQWVYLLLRVKNFTHISTVFGYSVAARLLKTVAGMLKSFAGEKGVAVHVSEDCFAILFPREGDKEQAEKRVGTLITELETASLTDGSVIYDYPCAFAGGLYMVSPRDEKFVVISRRVNAIAEAQERNRDSTYAWYEPKEDDQVTLQESLMPDILPALKDEQFVPFFQPQYNLETGEIVGAEVLARWQHPDKGVLLPGVFVPLLEANGCVLELDIIMLEQACKMIHSWLAKGLYPVPLYVNISRLNIHRRDFFERVKGIVTHYGIPSGLIALETTEAAVAENSGKILSLVRQLKAEGFIISMDDFGRGYSSLNMIREIPIDIVKLSRSFLLQFQNGDRARTILRHVVDMLHELNAEIVAEGVETAEQEAVIRETGCLVAQGFYYSRPVATEEFEQLMFPEGDE